MRRLLYSYSTILGLIKYVFYKVFYLSELSWMGIPRLSHRASLRIRNGGKLQIGQNTRITEGCHLWITEGAQLKIGSNTTVNVNCIMSCRDTILIGNNVMFGPCVTIFDSDHVYRTSGDMTESGYISLPVIIENNVWIGTNVKILKGVTIGEGSVVAAGSIVNRNVPPHSVFYNKKEDICKLITVS